jgi:hypothetical protein
MSYPVISYCIFSISCRILSYPVVSCRIMSHHVVACCILL